MQEQVALNGTLPAEVLCSRNLSMLETLPAEVSPASKRFCTLRMMIVVMIVVMILGAIHLTSIILRKKVRV